jgi:hypothetical protein
MRPACLLLPFLLNLFSFCNQPENKGINSLISIGYNLSAPDRVYILPQTLREISGITEIDASSIACIQDENETVFIYDINKNQIVRQLFSGYSGDYEGLARVNKTLYILRSDGVITEFADYESDKFKRTTYITDIPWKDNEGLCYDQKNNRLLIAPKEIPGKDSEGRDIRFIYGFSLSSKKFVQEPVFRYDLTAIEKFALDNKIKVPMKDKKDGKKEKPDIKFQMTALGIHPIKGSLFVLSGPERLLFVFDMKGHLVFMERLSGDLFNQPEGITFMKNGDMFISNEGKEKAPTLVRFNYKTTAPVKLPQ